MQNYNKENELLELSDYVLDTKPPMTVGDVLNKTDGVYFCIKNHESVFLWVNDNFAELFGKKPKDFIGKKDTQAAHVEHDKKVMASGVPLLNFHETIILPTLNGETSELEIVTQKGLLRKKGETEIIGITVCFSERYPNADEAANELIKELNMSPVGVGGYFAPVSESDMTIKEEALPKRFIGNRKAYSTNYYLLKSGDVLDLHALNQDEQWFFHQGSAIKLHIFSKEGNYSTETFGSDLAQGQKLQGIAPHNSWFGAELIGPGYALSSCSLAPSWDEKDSFIPSKEQIETLKISFPEQIGIIEKLTNNNR